MMIAKDEPDHSYNLIKETLENNPSIWFDNNSMGLTIGKSRQQVSRTMNRFKKNGIVNYKGRYFTLKVIKIVL